GLRTWIEQGVIPSEALVDDLKRSRAPVGVLDSRLQIAGSVSTFIARHYVRQPDGLLVAGAEVTVPGGAGQTDVDLLLGGTYEIAVTSGLQATIDGVVAEPPLIRLSEGAHRISWRGPAGTVRLTVAPCALRRPAAWPRPSPSH